MAKPKEILLALQSTLRIKNKMDEGVGLQTSQGFASHYSNIDNTDKDADVPDTELMDRNYQTNLAVGLPSSSIGDGITPLSGDVQNRGNPDASKIFFAKEQGIPGLPPPPEETPQGIPPMLQGKIPGLPGLGPPAPAAVPAAAPQGSPVMEPAGGAPQAPPAMEPAGGAPQAPPAMEPAGEMPQGGEVAPPGGAPGGVPGDPNAMAMGAPGPPVDMDPLTGLPIRQASEIGRIYELKKIYSRLTTIEAFLADTTDQDLIEVRNIIAQAIEFFEIVTSNLQSYKDKLDDIIVMFYEFLDQAYSMMAEYFKEKKESFDHDTKIKSKK